ncbi:MAG: protein-L-isoaspartate O-methyltransferase, partial [Alphaproteobacteria bacterium]|nr:protein-L-isoaspartate O-methyltransferase [Alphaproteobacteria bacterium]
IFLDRAVRNWESEGLTNITGVQGGLKEGYPSGAPFDLVIVNGAVPELSVGLINQLVPGGRLIVILKKPGEAMGQATLVERHGGDFSSRALFEAGCPYVPGFEPAPAFVF